MKISEKVIRYLENEMNNSEKAEFEVELKKSKKLQDEVSLYKSLIQKLNETKNVETDEGYFTTVIPKFRLRKTETKWSLVPKLTLGFAGVAIVLVLFFSLNRSSEINMGEQIPSFSSEEIDSISVYYPEYLTGIDTVIDNNEEYSSIVDEILADELDISEENLDSVYSLQSSISYYNDNFNNISDEEAQTVYNELINKRLF